MNCKGTCRAIAALPVRLVAFAALTLCSATVAAAIGIDFAVADIQGEGWSASGIRLSLSSQSPTSFSADIRVERLVLPEGQGDVQDLQLACDQVTLSEGAWDCTAGRLAVAASPIDKQDAAWSGAVGADGGWQIEIPRLGLANGTLALSVTADPGGPWRAGVRGHRLRVTRLAAFHPAISLPRWGIKGHLSGSLQANGQGLAATRVNADLLFDGVDYASPDGSQAAEGLLLKLELAARLRGGAWQFDGKLRAPRGAWYSEPVFIDTSAHALTAGATGAWQPSSGQVRLDTWALELDKTFTLNGTGQVDTARLALTDLTVAAHSDDAGRLYQALVQPFLIGTPGDDMEVSGQVGFVLHYDSGGMEQAGLQLNRLAFADRRGRFAMQPTDGSVAWQRDGEGAVSRVHTQGVSIYRISSDPFDLKTRFVADRVELVEPLVVPVLGGRVALDSFALTGALVAGDKPRWRASASVRDVSLEQFTQALAWPPFGGVVNGQLRDMRYADELFSIGGGLELQAFDGRIRVDGLSIREPLGITPMLRADAQMRDLNLEAVTRTFSLGRIEGRLNADLVDLQLIAWQPDRFDLHLFTPPDDDSRHRISQRAVDNLTELGSGVPAGLSSTFLSLFEEFNYSAIDLRVMLRGNVAELDGLARADGGYYLVKGAGLPRIDVIGRNRSVAWKDLLERLRQIRVEGAQIR